MKDVILAIIFICLVATGIILGPATVLLIMYNYTTAGFLVLVGGNLMIAVCSGILLGFLSTMRL